MAGLGPQSLTARQSLHLHIDPFTYKSHIRISPQTTSPPSANANNATLGTVGGTQVAPYDSGLPICSVLCMYDFRSDDSDHLSFYKNEILDIVKQEDTGWWAAIRKDGDMIGWIPQAFVTPISDEMAEKLRGTRKELRGYEYEAEQLYISAPIQPIPPLYEPASEPTTPAPPPIEKDIDYRRRTPSPQLYISKAQDLLQTIPASDPSYHLVLQYLQSCDQLPPSQSPASLQPLYASSFYDKSTIPSPSQEDPPPRGRAGSLPIRTAKRRPAFMEDHSSSGRLVTLHESGSSGEVVSIPGNMSSSSLEGIVKRTRSQRLKASIGLESIPAPKPVHVRAWYLKPIYADQLETDNEGHVRYGTLNALVEKLTSDMSTLDPIKMAEETMFRNIFLMTFRTFTTPDTLFDMLVEIYRMDHPKDLATAEFEEWKGHLINTQRRVLMIFTMWLEDHRLLEEEPYIAQRLTEFLRLITAPPLASMARLLAKTIQRLTFKNHNNISPIASPRKARKSRAHKNDLLKVDPVDIAEQLAILEFQRYAKVTPQEVLQHSSSNPGSNLSAFCSTHDKLASWVKISVLGNDALGKRADTIDFWIKVAEKCKILNNYASMSAVINALSSTVINRLHLTWAHVGRKSTLEALLRYNEPTGGFAGYRNLLRDVEGSCVPFIGMYLTDVVHIQDQFNDDNGRLCFLQRQRWYETISAMLRYQSRPYEIAESDSTMNFIWRYLREDPSKDASWFWSRSQDVQQAELAHADIRKGLEAAGF